MQTSNQVLVKGVVAWFDGPKGFGFIRWSDRERDAYVHFSQIKDWKRKDGSDNYRQLERNDKVEFELGKGPNGKPAAFSVRVIRQ